MNFRKSYRSIRSITLATLLFAVASVPASGQLGGLLDRTTDKLSREVQRMAVEKISDVIAQKAAKEIENQFDKLLREAIAEDSAAYDRDSAYYQLGSSYASFLEGLNSKADLPESYEFDLNMLVEVTSDDSEPQNMRYYFSEDEPIFAIQTATDEENWQIIVMDVGQDVTVLYQHDGDKKTAQALPNVMGLASKMSKSQMNEADAASDDYVITKLSGKERVAGYKCEGWQGENDENRFEAWLTDDLGIEWSETFGSFAQQFAPEAYGTTTWENMKGMALKSSSYDKKKGKLISAMEAQEVDKKSFEIVNSEYDFGYQQ